MSYRGHHPIKTAYLSGRNIFEAIDVQRPNCQVRLVVFGTFQLIWKMGCLQHENRHCRLHSNLINCDALQSFHQSFGKMKKVY